MAFVDRSEKQSNYIKSSTDVTVGPGSYITHSDYNQKQLNVPFNSSSIRDSDLQNKEILPGPGQYFINQGPLNEKVVVSSQNEEIKIVEIPKPLSIFKSGTKRFDTQVKIQENPGVGEYDLKSQFSKAQKMINQNSKNDIIDTLIKINKYLSVPSIPSQFQRYGYTENEQNELKLNRIPEIQHMGVKQDSVGPGHYNLNEQIIQNWKKGIEWHKYMPRDINLKDKMNGIGPGQYDINKFEPIYKLKPSPGFISKSLRYNDLGGKSKILKSASIRSLSTGQGLSNQNQEEEEESHEYIEGSTPAPGYYHNNSNSSSLKIQRKPEKFQFFGSSTDRFQYKNQFSQLGPGNYNPVLSFGKDIGSFQVQNPPFQSSNTRFEQRNIFELKPGPGQYQSIQSLENSLIKNIQNGYKGNFGINDKRFKYHDSNLDNPGPGQYIESIKEFNEDDLHQSAVFKSAKKRETFDTKKEQKPGVGSYTIDHYDMKKNIFKQQDEEDFNLIVKRPGFQSSAPRFKEPILETVNEEEQLLSPNTKGKKLLDYTNMKPKPLIPFSSKQKRFDSEKTQKSKKQLGPGQYFNPNSNNWNKRTYNILFAEI